MGTWGMKAFESDDAMDWVSALEESGDDSAVREALTTAADAPADEYLEAPDGQVALAAAEVVAAATGQPGDLPDEVVGWVATHASSVVGHVELARRAIERVMAATNSELRDLWSTEEGAAAADVAEWESHVADLRRRLSEKLAE